MYMDESEYNLCTPSRSTLGSFPHICRKGEVH